jgi:type VI secretion system secreted protein VgrG
MASQGNNLGEETTDARRLLALDTPLGKDVLLVTRFAASEQLSRLFGFDLDLIADLPKARLISAEALIGQPVSVRLTLAEGAPAKERFFHGIVSRFVEGGQDTLFAYYQLQIVPRLWLLTLASNCRIFQEKTVPEIIKDVLERHGFVDGKDFRNQLDRTYTKWDYCVQYRETDYNFLSRIMEQEGISYSFKHDERGHTLLLLDTLEKAEVSENQPEARFAPVIGFGETGESVASWQKVQMLAPGKVTLRDHHFEVPAKSLEASEPTAPDLAIGGNSALEVYDFPGEYAQKFYQSKRLSEQPSALSDEATRVAKVRMEEEESPAQIFVGSSDCRGFEVGHRFTLTGHRRLSGKFVLTSLQHSTDQNPAHFSGRAISHPYSNTMSCIRFGRPFRPARVTLRPVVQGPQTAVVVGPRGGTDAGNEEIWTDQFGRVKVQFPWDREGQLNDKSSCWIRVSQPWAGQQWGGVWLPRVGQEVIVDFLEGDPDQPIITGRVYNADQMPPFTLPDNKTQSGFKTRSSPKGGTENFNLLRFEDKKGHEDVLIHAERTMHNSVEASQFITVGVDRHITTGGMDKDGNQIGDVKEKVFKNHNLHVLKDAREKVEGKESRTLIGDSAAQYQGNRSVQITGDELVIAANITIQAQQKITLMAGSSSIVIDPSGVTVIGVPMINLNPMAAVPPIPPLMPLIDAPDDP